MTLTLILLTLIPCKVRIIQVPPPKTLEVEPLTRCFTFSVGCDDVVLREGVEEVRIAWNMVLRGWKGVFMMMERVGKVGSRPTTSGGSRRSCQCQGVALVWWWQI
ncbi:hypothetical protein glysoja_030625 [Glycine soja]|uniref:Uncharacterized protein n=1 Tax=Glycine soja TaxID=3848 RepID=A0A0B2R0A0_GLYSO|nr:hypothetical protein glysoja_030625 [Glycine soja]